jgi:hypothetical protein
MFLLYSPLVIAWLGLSQFVQDSQGYWAMVAFARLFGMALFAWGGTILTAYRFLVQSDFSEQSLRNLLLILVIADFLGAFSAAIQAASVWGIPSSWLISLGFGVLGILNLLLLTFSKKDIH